MENHVRATLQSGYRPDAYRTTARAVGALFLAGMVVYIVGNGLAESLLAAPDRLSTVATNSMQLAIGAMLMLMASAFDAAHGILMLPVLKRYNERAASAILLPGSLILCFSPSEFCSSYCRYRSAANTWR